MRSILSILGLYQYDNTIFNSMQLPEGVNRGTLTDNLLCELAELEVLYPDPDFMKALIAKWSAKELPVWQKLYATTKFDYNPIYNYDRTEEWTEKSTTKQNVTGTSKATDTAENISKVAGYNEEQLVTRDGNNSNSTTNAEDVVDTDVQHGNTRTGRTYGNIGVTTTQQMIEAERDVVKFNIYDYIIDSFKRRFCLLVY